MSRISGHADDERNGFMPPERNFSVSSQVNANNAKGYTDLGRYAFVMSNSQEKNLTTASTSLTSHYTTLMSPSHFPFSPAPNAYESSAAMTRIGPRPIYLDSHQSTTRENHDFSYDGIMTDYGHHSPRQLQYTQGLQTTLRGEFELEAYEHASPPYGPHENSALDSYLGVSPVTSPTGVYSRPTSSLKAAPTRTRTRTTPRHQHHQYLDSLLRSKCPKDRVHALNIAIQFRDEHNVDELIPNDLLDELLEAAGDDKYICFCCPRARKARTITPARDHVRKSLGNFPFQCANSWCRHSSLRQADLNKHMKTCINTAASQ